MIAGTAIRKVSKGDKFESHSPIFAFNPLWDRGVPCNSVPKSGSSITPLIRQWRSVNGGSRFGAALPYPLALTICGSSVCAAA